MFKSIIDQDSYISLLGNRHSEELFELMDNSRDSIGEWLDFPKHTHEINDTRKFIERTLSSFAANNGYWVGIWHKGKLAGSIGYLYFDWHSKKTEIGYWLSKDFEGLGLDTKACSLFMKYAFEELKLHKVEICMATSNIRSRAVPERLGFKEEGTVRCFEFLNGKYLDRVTYGMIGEEWSGNFKDQKIKGELNG